MVAKPGPEGAGNLQEERESLCPGGAGYIRGWGGVGDRVAPELGKVQSEGVGSQAQCLGSRLTPGPFQRACSRCGHGPPKKKKKLL